MESALNQAEKLAESAANSFDKKHWLEVAAHCRKMAAAEEAATKVSPIRRPVART